jgi:hypothetical protein
MKLYVLKCDQGYLRRLESGCQSVKLEKATVVNESGLEEMEAIAKFAGKAGFTKICLMELFVTEGDCVEMF